MKIKNEKKFEKISKKKKKKEKKKKKIILFSNFSLPHIVLDPSCPDQLSIALKWNQETLFHLIL